MKTTTRVLTLLILFLLVLTPIIAGCLTVPGPEPAKKTTPVTAAVTRSPGTTVPTVTATRLAVVTTSPVPSMTMRTTGYAQGTCTELGGFMISPGQQCKGAWFSATNTLSCCSVSPAPVESRNTTVKTGAFNLTVSLDDSLGSITP